MRKLKFMSVESVLIAFGAFMAFYTSVSNNVGDALSDQKEQKKITSVSMMGGKYKIDSGAIWKEKYKEALLTELKSEDLIQKENSSEIPDFILAFLDSLSSDKKFEMADPWEDWQVGNITDFGIPVLKKLGHLPNKKLVYFGLGKNMALFSFLEGGFRMSQQIVIFKFQNKRIVDFWYNKSQAFVASKEELLEHIRSKPSQGGC